MRKLTSGRFASSVYAAALAGCFAIAAPTLASASCDVASAKATQLGKSVTDTVANGSLSTGQRLTKFRQIFKNNADFPTMARFALGKYWRDLPKGSQGEYFRLVEDLVVRVLFGQLENYAGQRYSITTERCLPKGSKGVEFYVEGSVLNASGAKMTNVKWWFLKRGGSIKVFDFQVAGIWLTQQKRDEFTSFLKAQRGDVNTLLKSLRERTGA